MANSIHSVNNRAKELLRILVEHYLAEGQPVGSKTLSSISTMPISSATIRNVMAGLESQGLVESPHTSAGRVPTAQGIRLFVDRLITIKPLETKEFDLLKSHLNPDQSTQQLIQQASGLLSSITNLTGVVTVAKQNQSVLRHVEFLPLPGNRILVILVVNDRDVQNRVIHTHRPYSESELQKVSNYLNQTYGGLPLEHLVDAIVKSMQDDKKHVDQLMQTSLEVAAKAIDAQSNSSQEDCIVAGKSNLIDSATNTEHLEQVRELLDAFRSKQDILHLLKKCLQAEGVHIFIGSESGHKAFDDFSIITAPYEIDKQVVGVLGVIGPTRMAYNRVIPIVDATSKILSAALNHF